MKILITGGAGFISSRLSIKLANFGHEVHIVDNLSESHESNVPSEAKFIFADVSDSLAMKSIFKSKYDIVFHLAAISSTELVYENLHQNVDTNIRATLDLVDLSSKTGVKKFIFASSMAVYGNPNNPNYPVTEHSATNVISLYGLGKLISELNCNQYIKNDFEVVNTRFFNVYGAGQDIENIKQGIVSIFAHYIYYDKPILTKGSRERFRDFVYVDDVIDALYLIASKKEKFINNTFNICSGKRTTIKDLQELLIKGFGKNIDSYPINVEGTTPADQFGILDLSPNNFVYIQC